MHYKYYFSGPVAFTVRLDVTVRNVYTVVLYMVCVLSSHVTLLLITLTSGKLEVRSPELSTVAFDMVRFGHAVFMSTVAFS